MILTPIDTLKTTLQVQGSRGTTLLHQRIKTNGIGSLWWGAFATAAATFVGHYPWFATYNFLSETIPAPPKHSIIVWLLRLAFIGFVASVVSDSVSNSLRVVKTYRQVNDTQVSYSKSTLVLSDRFASTVLIDCSRGSETGSSTRWSHGVTWPWAQDQNLVQRFARTAVQYSVEIILRSVSTLFCHSWIQKSISQHQIELMGVCRWEKKTSS